MYGKSSTRCSLGNSNHHIIILLTKNPGRRAGTLDSFFNTNLHKDGKQGKYGQILHNSSSLLLPDKGSG